MGKQNEESIYYVKHFKDSKVDNTKKDFQQIHSKFDKNLTLNCQKRIKEIM
jgi:hypothetical protein